MCEPRTQEQSFPGVPEEHWGPDSGEGAVHVLHRCQSGTDVSDTPCPASTQKGPVCTVESWEWGARIPFKSVDYGHQEGRAQ
ncbi:rCG24811, isoform CRA_a [Rattus norvegicus]|uniref:RCG24811, isoform CRA_a n=1 Tax=Rattus norvegicus TaxID=10116 RepID=A6JCA1_RAT|nr:rCG24811, isoform CRA_a [Rattus norvegicus]